MTANIQRRRFVGEPTQPGNPHKLTRRQHVFPRKSIDRFCDTQGRVEVVHVAQSRLGDQPVRFRAKSDADIFVASRVWDQRAEDVSQRHVEAPFQFLAERILKGDAKRWHRERRHISPFYALWHSRFEHAWHPEGDLHAKGIVAETRTKDEEEILERNGYLFMSEGKMPARQVNGMRVQMRGDYIEAQLHDFSWGIWTASELAGEFVVPDYCPLRPIVPLTPRIILIAGMDDAVVTREEVAQVNLLSLMGAHQYVFARDYRACPIVPERSRPPFSIRKIG